MVAVLAVVIAVQAPPVVATWHPTGPGPPPAEANLSLNSELGRPLVSHYPPADGGSNDQG